jgi:hypothetical protein
VCFTQAGSNIRTKKTLRGLQVGASFAIETARRVPTVGARESIKWARCGVIITAPGYHSGDDRHSLSKTFTYWERGFVGGWMPVQSGGKLHMLRLVQSSAVDYGNVGSLPSRR